MTRSPGSSNTVSSPCPTSLGTVLVSLWCSHLTVTGLILSKHLTWASNACCQFHLLWILEVISVFLFRCWLTHRLSKLYVIYLIVIIITATNICQKPIRCQIGCSKNQGLSATLLFTYLILAVLGLHSCVAFSNYRKWGLLSSCCVGASYCGGFSCCRARALGHTGSVVVEHGLSCSKVYGIFMDQGSKSCLLYWQMDSFPLSCWKPSATLSGRGFCYSILQVKKWRPVYSYNPQSFTKYYLEL